MRAELMDSSSWKLEFDYVKGQNKTKSQERPTSVCDAKEKDFSIV